MKELLLLLVLLLSACSDGPEPDTLDINEDFKCSKNGVSAPEWVCGNIESEDIQVAIGMSEYSKIGKSFNLSEATANGVMKIEVESQSYIKAKIQKFARMMDPELGAIADHAMQDIAKTINQADNNDYKQIKEWKNPTNSDLYVLVAIQNKWLDREIKAHLLFLYKSDASLYKKFLALDGEDKLDDLLD